MLDSSKNIFFIGMCALILGGCGTTVKVLSCDDGRDVRWFSTPTEHVLNNAIKSYEDGNYSTAMITFQDLVDNKSVPNSERIVALKYLAFIHCISPTETKEQRERMCRDSFKKAFDLNPYFNLSPAEAGHPVWGPIFSSVKNKLPH